MNRSPAQAFLAALLAAALALPAACGGTDQPQAAPPETPPPAPAQAARPSPANADAIRVDEKARSVSIPAVVAKQQTYAELKGAIEYALVAKGGKEYESLFVTDRPPAEIREALLRIGLRGGQPATEDALPGGQRVNVFVACEADGKAVRRPLDDFLLDTRTGQPVPPAPWTFTGSAATIDPDTGQAMLQASLTGSLIGLHPADASPLFQNARPESRQENIYRPNLKALPPAGTRVRIVFERAAAQVPEGTRRVHVFVGGRVQGVGFRAFTQNQARQRGLAGFVRNLADGRVEAVLEGPGPRVAEVLEQVKHGPRAASVEKVEATDETPEGDSGPFEIWY
jgi:acylphosphatase